MKLKHLIPIILIIILSLVSYWNIFKNEFVWDDYVFILENSEIKSFSNFGNFFLEDVDGLYRPLRTFHYAIIYSLFKKNEFGYHLNSIIFHISISILIFFLGKELFGSKIGLLSSLIFAVHPIHTDRVTNMTAGLDLLGIFLMLLAFYFYLIFSKKKKRIFLFFSILIFIVSLFASEEAITLPLIVLFHDFCFKKENFTKTNIKKTSFIYFAFFAVGLLYIIFRFFVLGIQGRMENYLAGNFYLTQLTMTKVFVKYIALLFFPLNLNLFQSVNAAKGIFEAYVIASILTLILILYFTLRNYNNKHLFFSISWFFITLMPMSNIIPIQVFMAERYLYLPSLSFSFLFSYYFLKFYEQFDAIKGRKIRMLLVIFLILLLIFYVGRTFVRNNDWKNNIVLWSKTVSQNPDNSRAHDNLGFTYEQMGLNEKALSEFQKAVFLMPDNFRALTNLGVAYAKNKEYNKSVIAIKRALDINPEFYKGYDKLGLIYAETGNIQGAILNFNQAIRINPRYAKAYNDLATVYGKIGNFNLSLYNFKKTIELDKDYGDAHYNLGILYDFLGEKELAKHEFEIAYILEPENELFAGKLKNNNAN